MTADAFVKVSPLILVSLYSIDLSAVSNKLDREETHGRKNASNQLAAMSRQSEVDNDGSSSIACVQFQNRERQR